MYKTRIDNNQDPKELTQFLDFIVDKKIKRYLEIGSRNGNSFYAVMEAIGKEGYGLAIDLTENRHSKMSLVSTSLELLVDGIDNTIIFGNSKDLKVLLFARDLAPFDLILIDADHSYQGVKDDYWNYHYMGKYIAFHDIDAPEDWDKGSEHDLGKNNVQRFWKEVREGKEYVEFINKGSNMGYGILYPK